MRDLPSAPPRAALALAPHAASALLLPLATPRAGVSARRREPSPKALAHPASNTRPIACALFSSMDALSAIRASMTHKGKHDA